MLGRTATDSQPLASSYKQQSRRLVSCLRLCFSPHTYALYTPTLGCRDNSEREVHYSRHSKRAFDPGRFYGTLSRRVAEICEGAEGIGQFQEA